MKKNRIFLGAGVIRPIYKGKLSLTGQEVTILGPNQRLNKKTS